MPHTDTNACHTLTLTYVTHWHRHMSHVHWHWQFVWHPYCTLILQSLMAMSLKLNSSNFNRDLTHPVRIYYFCNSMSANITILYVARLNTTIHLKKWLIFLQGIVLMSKELCYCSFGVVTTDIVHIPLDISFLCVIQSQLIVHHYLHLHHIYLAPVLRGSQAHVNRYSDLQESGKSLCAQMRFEVFIELCQICYHTEWSRQLMPKPRACVFENTIAERFCGFEIWLYDYYMICVSAYTIWSLNHAQGRAITSQCI